MIHAMPLERRNTSRNVRDNVGTFLRVKYPVKESRLADPEQPSLLKELPGEQNSRMVTLGIQIKANYSMRDHRR